MIFNKRPLAAGLHFVATPIGTARDITLRALDTLASADVLAAEDTRTLRKLMEIHGVPLEGRHVVAYHDHSGPEVRARLVAAMAEGKSVAYASEAGMPLVADPGFALARAATEAGIAVTCVPGPSAVTTALAIAGLPTDRFFFAGFLPNTSSQRLAALSELAAIPATLVFFEAPGRVQEMLGDLAQALGETRQAAVCRELTKRFEEVRRGTLGELAAQDVAPRGEHVIVVDRAHEAGAGEDEIAQALREAMKTMRVKDAATVVAGALGLPRRQVYQTALALQETED